MASLLVAALFISTVSMAQNARPKPASPPDSTEATLASGTTVKINYSAPSVKGRAIGTVLEPLPGKVWRTGANNATTFAITKNVTIEGKSLAAGTYSLFTLVDGDAWTIIFNKTAKQWGAFKYVEADDAIRVNVKGKKAATFTEQLKIVATKEGKVTILWGDKEASFWVK